VQRNSQNEPDWLNRKSELDARWLLGYKTRFREFVFSLDVSQNRRKERMEKLANLAQAKKLFTFAILLLLLVSLVAMRARAQASTGAVNGTISDPNGLAVEGATVTVHSAATGIDTTLTSNETGAYGAPYLQPGAYDITVSKSGFQEVTTKGVVVHVGERLTVDLQVGLATQQGTVTVTAEAPLIETEKTSQAQTIDQNQVQDLPMAGRRWETFTLLTPGTTTDGSSGLSSFRGISSLYNGNSVDGANNTQAFFSEARGRAIIVTYVYSPDSVQEFQVNGSNYSAEYGQAAGGTVNAVTRSGTNNLHGDLFYDLRYPSLNALDPVGKVNHIFTQPVHQQNHFGGSVGGPAVKDKLFYFATYDGFRKVNPILYTSSSTPAGVNAFVCPLSASAAACANGKAFITQDLLGAFPRKLRQDVALGKLDYQLNAANRLNAVFNWQNWQEPNGYNTAPTVNNGGVTQNGNGGTHERFLIAHWISTLSSNKVNEATFQWGRDFEFDTTNSGGPSVALTNIASYGETSALPRPAFPDEHRIEIGDNLTWIKGNHTFKFGADLNFIHELLINLFQGDGNYSYTNTDPFDGCPGATTSNSTLANGTFCRWLDDAVGANVGDGFTGKHWASFTQVNDPITHVGRDDFYDNDTALFAEDTWKFQSNVTFNLGVRYDLQHVPAPPKPNTATPLLTLYTSTLNIDSNNFAPRLGVAWQLSPKTVVRGGYGIFYGKTSNSTYYALRVENGVYQQTFSGCNPTSSNPLLVACAPNFPNTFFTPPGPAQAAPFAGALTPTVGIPGGTLPASSAAAHGMTPNFVNPVAHEVEIAVERQLPGDMAVSATYLLTRGLHLPASYDANLSAPTTTRTYDVLNGSAGATVLQPTVPFFTTANRIDNTGIILNQYSNVNSWYNGLILTLRKPMKHDLEVVLNYTYSKSLDDGETTGTNGTFFGTDGVLNPYNLKEDYSVSDLDQRQRFVGTLVWQPTYFKDSSNRAAKGALSGWIVSAILVSGTGQPYTALISTFTPSGAPDGGMTGGAVSTFASSSGSRASWLGRNSFTLPTTTGIDMRIGRSFAIKEKYQFSFSADAFNLFNSNIVQAANTTAYSYSAPAAPSIKVPNPACPIATHTNACLVPNASFRSPTTTSGTLYGARQMQINARFEF
jgi:hypothetical protein